VGLFFSPGELKYTLQLVLSSTSGQTIQKLALQETGLLLLECNCVH